MDGSFFDIAHVPSPTIKILCVGTVDLRKNQNALIKALDGLKPQGKFELVFLGPARRELPYGREFFESIEARPWCHYGGYADREALKQHLASASGLVLPSLEDNCPMVVLEAMAAGVPVAGARVGGVPDLIRHGETGPALRPSESAVDGRCDEGARRESRTDDGKAGPGRGTKTISSTNNRDAAFGNIPGSSFGALIREAEAQVGNFLFTCQSGPLRYG